MSVRVNLLPVATRERDRAARQRGVAGGLFLVVLLALGSVWLVQDRKLGGLEAELAAEQQVVSALEAEKAELAAYAELAARLTAADERVRTALSAEVSFAGALQDVAAVTPPDTGLLSLTIDVQPPIDGTEAIAGAAVGPVGTVGTVNLSGHSLTGHAPGVERILLELDKVYNFDEPFFNSSTLDEDGVATFNLDVGLQPRSRTGRYDEGVPEDLR
jgi:hypothetical protein